MLGSNDVLRILTQKVYWRSARIAIASGLLAGCLKITDHNYKLDYMKDILPEHYVFTGFASTLAFLLVFRSVQSLNLYREGVRNMYQMAGAWYNVASTLMSYCRAASAESDQVVDFKHTMVRLFSMLNMQCLSELAGGHSLTHRPGLHLDVVDAEGLDMETIRVIKDSQNKQEIINQLIQCLVVGNLNTGVLQVPPPILSTLFQDLGKGMLKFHETVHISDVRVPLPLVFLIDGLLLVHAIFAPSMICVWAKGPIGAAGWTFVTVFVVNILNGVSCEVENPFHTVFDVDLVRIHSSFNVSLAELVYLDALPTSNSRLHDSLQVKTGSESRDSWGEMSTPTKVRRQSMKRKIAIKQKAMNAVLQSMLENSERRHILGRKNESDEHGPTDFDLYGAAPDHSEIPVAAGCAASPKLGGDVNEAPFSNCGSEQYAHPLHRGPNHGSGLSCLVQMQTKDMSAEDAIALDNPLRQSFSEASDRLEDFDWNVEPDVVERLQINGRTGLRPVS